MYKSNIMNSKKILFPMSEVSVLNLIFSKDTLNIRNML